MSSNTTKPYNDGDKVFLFLAYFGIFSLIPFFMFKGQTSDSEKEFVYWHAAQGLAFTVVAIALNIVIMILTIILALLHLGALGSILSMAIMLLMLAGMILGWIKSFGGEKWDMPVVSKLAGMIRG